MTAETADGAATEALPHGEALADLIRTVLEDGEETVSAYRGKAYLWPFAQGGKYWREADVVALRDRIAAEGPMHFAAISYIEDAAGALKWGYREIRGALTVTVDEGRVLLHSSGHHWHVITACAKCADCRGRPMPCTCSPEDNE